MPKRYEIKTKRGKEYKICNGRLHNGQWVSVTDFYPRWDNKDRLRGQCKYCEKNTYNIAIGMVPIHNMRFVITELENKLGTLEAARRVGVSNSTWYRWRSTGISMRASRAVMLFKTLREVRANGEVRHRKSIKHGAKQRGRKEKVPTTRRDYYRYQD